MEKVLKEVCEEHIVYTIGFHWRISIIEVKETILKMLAVSLSESLCSHSGISTLLLTARLAETRFWRM
jgi:hypothetical protein